MTQMNQNQNPNDFRIAISFKIEGHNCRGAIIRFAGIAVTIISIIIKIGFIFWKGH